MKRLELGAAARADLAGIWRYTFCRWGRAQADRYNGALDEAMTCLAAGEDAGRPAVRDYYGLRVGSHLVFYRELPDLVRVVRVLHVRMDAERHLPF